MRSSRLVQTRQVATCAHNIKARWLIDIRYGMKLDAVELLQEWVADIGAQAGLTPFNATISSGAVGVPESRLELEVAFDSIAELEGFWAAIPPERHRAWSQRAQHVIIDGSPQWHVFRTVALSMSMSDSEVQIVAQPSPTQRPKWVPRQLAFDAAQAAADQAAQDTEQQTEAGASSDYTGPVDWKGDPMVINPGDKLPFF